MYEWKKAFPMTALGTGKVFFEKKKVRLQVGEDGIYTATVVEREPYHVKIFEKSDSSSYKMQCDCPIAKSGMNCKHMAATMYAIEHRENFPEQYVKAESGSKNDNRIVQETESVNVELNKAEETKTIVTAVAETASETISEETTLKEISEEVSEETAQVIPEITPEVVPEIDYIYESINPSSAEVIDVNWPNVELDNYVYFEKELIWKDMNFPQKIVHTAKRIVRDNRIQLEKVNIGYIDFEDNIIGEVIGEGKDGKLSFPVHIRFGKEEVLSTVCRCRSCSKRYYFYAVEKSTCEYVAALLLLLQDYLREHRIGDATSRSGVRLIEAFQQNYVRDARRSQLELKGKVSVLPRLQERGGELQVSFKIEDQKSFVIKDLEEFCNNIQKSEVALYGNSTYIHHDLDNFTVDARKWITFINKALKEENTFTSLFKKQGGYFGRNASKKEALQLFGSRLDEFYELVSNSDFYYENNDKYEKRKARLLCKEENPKIRVNIKKNDMSTRTVFHGISVECDMPQIFEGAENGYYIDEYRFCKISNKFYQNIKILKQFRDKDETIFEVGRYYLTDFYRTVLPKLQEFAEITETNLDDINQYLAPQVQFVFYLDVEEGDMFCKVMAQYGDREYNILSAIGNEEMEPFREVAKEIEISLQVQKFFPEINEKDAVYMCSGDENRIFEVLHSGVDFLLSLGEVKCTGRFRNLKVGRKIKLNVGVSLSEGLLDISLIAENVDREELNDILKSYRSKKKYHKLKSGDFLSLEDDSIVALEEMVSLLRLSPKELIKGKAHVPAYRALYLDKLLERNEEIYNSRDSYFKELVKNFKTISDADYEEPESLKNIMREYQRYGFRWLKTLEQVGFGGILADDMGLGKTLQVIAVLLSAKEAGKDRPALVITPASLVYNWCEEIRKFAPALEVCIISGNQEDRHQKIQNITCFDVIITSYDLLKRDISYYEEINFEYQIIDEAQYIKNQTTAAAKAVKAIKSKVRYALTGTPIENRLSELWSIFDYLMPGYLYGYDSFHRDYEIPIVKYAEQEAMERLKHLTNPFILRRLKENVLKDLPEKLEENYYVGFSGVQQQLYDAQVLHMKQQVAMQDSESFKQNKIQILAELMKIRQICCDPSLCFENYNGESAKLEACLDLLDRAMEGGHRILVFSQFTSMLAILGEKLSQKGVEYYTITGSVSKEERIRLVERFNSGTVPVFLISLKAGGVGLNLIGADVVVHYDPWWNIAVQNQATDRAHRIGQTKNVVVYKLLVKNSIEEKIQKLQESKKHLSDEIITGETNNLGSMSKEDFLELLEM